MSRANPEGSARYRRAFDDLEPGRSGAFVPYLTLGDPSPSATLELASTAIRAGADALELGIPFSDPIADGPAIQDSVRRALASGVTPGSALEVAAGIRDRHPDVPLGLLVYANLVYRPGPGRFFSRARAAGLDSVLLPDVPTIEAEPFAESARDAGLAFVTIVPPNASEAATRAAARQTDAFTYVVTRDGPTGADREAKTGHIPHLEALRTHGAPPALVGFGISRPAHAADAVRSGAIGAISGSAVARRIAAHPNELDDARASVAEFVGAMKRAATNPDTTDEETP